MGEVRKRLPLQCPACDSPLRVGRLFCGQCDTEVCGNFELPLLARLTEKEQQFIVDFIKSSGSLKDMAKSMGVSYPTVRNVLDDLIDKVVMKRQWLNFLVNPFEWIAGGQALGWGLLGMVVSTVICYLSGWHYHGLLHFGPAPNPAWWCYAVEHLVVWIVPAVLFYLGGLILSRSRIRVIDVLGTVAFAQLPFIFMNLFNMLPPMQNLAKIDMNVPPMELMAQPGFLVGIWLSLIGMLFLVWALVWMFKALKVSCNLKGYPLGILYCVAVFGGDILCRYLIGLCY